MKRPWRQQLTIRTKILVSGLSLNLLAYLLRSFKVHRRLTCERFIYLTKYTILTERSMPVYTRPLHIFAHIFL